MSTDAPSALHKDKTERSSPIGIDRAMVDRCFGCGAANEAGLKLNFECFTDGIVETRHRPDPNHCGVDTVVHGGIQATILDEVMGVAAQLSLPDGSSNMACVTAEMNLQYRRPVPMDGYVVARAKVERIEGRDIYVSGAILNAEGRALTEASSRWRQLRSEL